MHGHVNVKYYSLVQLRFIFNNNNNNNNNNSYSSCVDGVEVHFIANYVLEGKVFRKRLCTEMTHKVYIQ